MANKYIQSVTSAKTRFTKAPMGELEFSKMTANPKTDTAFNAGALVPIKCVEVLPHDTFSVDLDFVCRQVTALVPTMDQMDIEVFAFEVPNRVVNHSWKNVMGENTSGQWVAPSVSLCPLFAGAGSAVAVPVGSVADYYGFPTQDALPAELLEQCHDLKFRGYLEIYNNYFRDQNYQPPIPYSKLNIYNGFFEQAGDYLLPDGIAASSNDSISIGPSGDGSYPDGAITRALFGDGITSDDIAYDSADVYARKTSFSALGKPLKVNKYHDYFTSVLPSPQKGPSVIISSLTPMPVMTSDETYVVNTASRVSLISGSGVPAYEVNLIGGVEGDKNVMRGVSTGTASSGLPMFFNNLYANPENSTITLDDLRMSAAVQQVYEILGRGGSRYREFINSFFGLDIDNPFDDVPTLLGHIRRPLDLYQTAQTSASGDTPQGNLAAFGYTNNGGHLFVHTVKEHGYIHFFAVIRHRNIYPAMMARDNFRMNMLDFYSYPLANISEQPVYTREINPFTSQLDDVFGYQEAWAEYRMFPNEVTGLMRPGVEGSLSFWNLADNFDSSLRIASGDWLKSNSAEVLSRSVAIQDTDYPQFKASFGFRFTMERPLPTYSVAGLDIL